MTVADTTLDQDQQNDLPNQTPPAIAKEPRLEAHDASVALSADIESSALIVVDTGIEGYQDLLADLEPDTEILLIDGHENGLQKLADYVQGRDDISAIHILSHGDQGEFSLGSATINSDNIDRYAGLLAQIGASLTAAGDLLLYGCNVAEDGTGIKFVASIADYTNADLAASTDLTGAAAQGGDWDLEYTVGQIDDANLTLTSFSGLLTAPTAADDSGTTDENSTMLVTAAEGLLVNDKDSDGDTLIISEVNGVADKVGSLTDGSNGGQFKIEVNGSYTFNPGTSFDDLTPGVTRTTWVDYTVSDSNGGTATARLTITVSGANDAPVAVDDSGSTGENTLISVANDHAGQGGLNADLLLNDSDVNGDRLSIAAVAGATLSVGKATAGSSGGQFTIHADGSWGFDPGTSFDDLATGSARTTSVTYTVSDDNGGTATGTLIVFVSGADDAPTAVDDSGATGENTLLTVANDAAGAGGKNADLLLNDSDPEKDRLRISQVNGDTANVARATAGSSGGQFMVYSDGSWRFDPGSVFDGLAAGVTRTTSIGYTVSDGNDGTDTATLTVTVNGVNDVPTAVNDRGTTDEDSSFLVGPTAKSDDGVNAGLLVNDKDPEGNTLRISQVEGDADNVGEATAGRNGGQFTIYVTGAYNFVPGKDFHDLAVGKTRDTSVEYTVSDGKGGTATATLTVTVTGVNDAPRSVADAGTTIEYGSLTVANGDEGVGGENADLLLNDVDLDDGDSLSISQVEGAVSKVGVATAGRNGGQFTIRADGSWGFDPDADFDDLDAGESDLTSVSYTVSDGNGGTTTGWLMVTVNGANGVPVLTAATGTATEDASVVSGNLVVTGSVSSSGDGISGFKAEDIRSSYGTLKIVAAGTWTYEADNSQVAVQGLKAGGSLTDILTVTSADNVTTTTVTITIHGANDKPTLTPASATVKEDTAVAEGNLLVAGGTVSATGGDAGEDQFKPVEVIGDYGTLEIKAPGVWTWKADNGQYDIQSLTGRQWLKDIFTVTSADGVTTTTVTIDINGKNDALTLTKGTATVTEDTAVSKAGNLVASGTVSATGGDGVAGFKAEEDISGTYGTLTIKAAGAWTYKADNSQADIQGLGAGESLTDTLTVTGADTVTTTTVTITINGTNDKPTLTGATATLTEDVAVDADGKLVASGTVSSSGGDKGEAGFTAETVTSSVGSLEIEAGGDWTYTADNSHSDIQDLGVGATLTDTLTVTSADAVTTTTVTITINGADDALTLTGATAAVTEDVAVVSGNLVASGTVSSSGGDGVSGFKAEEDIGGSVGTLEIEADGDWTYKANNSHSDIQGLGVGATLTDTLTVTGADTVTTTTVTITINGANDAPTANNDRGTTGENVSLDISDGDTGTTNADLLLNDSDRDGDPLSITQVNGATSNLGAATAGSHGGQFTVYNDGSWRFNPGTNFDDLKSGEKRTTSVEYTISDLKGGTDTATLTVTVNGANDAPTANDDKGSISHERVRTVPNDWAGGVNGVNADLLLNDSDADGGSLKITAVSGATNKLGVATAGSNGGQFTIHVDGSWSFNPGTVFDHLDGKAATTSIGFTVSDGQGGTDTATLTVTVSDENRGMTTAPDRGTTGENVSLNISDGDTGTTNADLLLNDFDLDGDPLSIRAVAGAVNKVGVATAGSNGGQFTVHANGSWSFNPGTDFDDLKLGQTRTTSIGYIATDGPVGSIRISSIITILTVTVNGADDKPSLTGATATVTEDTSVISGNLVASGTVSSSGGDKGEAGFKAEEDISGSVGSLEIDAQGAWTYKANNSHSDIQGLGAGATLTDTLTVTSADTVTTTTVIITINGANDKPTLTGATATLTEDVAVVSGNLVASGTVSATGGDDGEDRFTAETVTSSVGSLEIEADGDWAYKANNSHSDIQDLGAGATLTDTLTVTSADTVTTTTVTITINGADDEPTLTPDTGSVTEDDANEAGKLVADGTVSVSGGDTSDDQFRAEELTGSYGTLEIEADGSWTYTADNSQADIQGLKAGGSLTDTFTVTSADTVTTTTVTITINGANEAPTLTKGTGTVTEDTSVNDAGKLVATGTVSSSGGDGATGFKAEDIRSSYGTLKIVAAGTWTYEADNSQVAVQSLKAGGSLTDILTVTSADGVTTTTVTITINGKNDAPRAILDTYSTSENTPLTLANNQAGGANVLLNDIDLDGDTLSVSRVGTIWTQLSETNLGIVMNGRDGGKFRVNADGSWSFDPGTDFDDLKPGQTRETRVYYTVSDGNGGTASNRLGVTVTGKNDAPRAILDTYSTSENTPLTLANNQAGGANVLLNDIDLDGDTLSVSRVGTIWTQLSETNLGIVMNGRDGGKFKVNADGSWRFDPGTGFDDLKPGQTRETRVYYTVSDGNGGTASNRLGVTVTGANDDPTLTPGTGSVTEDASVVSGNLVASGTVSASGGDKGEDQFMTTPVTGTYGSLTITADGAWTYTAANSQVAVQGLKAGESLTDTFTVTSADRVTTTTVTITINGKNDAPRAILDTYSTSENTPLTLANNQAGGANVLLNDIDLDGDTLSVSRVGTIWTQLSETNLGIVMNGRDGGKFKVNADGSWRFDPGTDFDDLKPGQTRETRVYYTVSDGNGGTASNRLGVTVTGANDDPTITGTTTGSVTEDAGLVSGKLEADGRLSISGGDAGEAWFRAGTVSGSYGSLTIDTAGVWKYQAVNSQSDIQDLSPTTTLTDTFTVTGGDGVTTTRVTITIKGANDDPILTKGTDSVTEDVVDDNGKLVASGRLSSSGGDKGEAGFTAGTVSGSVGSLTIDAAGAWKYQAVNSQLAIQELAPGNSLTDTFTVTGGDSVTTTMVTITINGANDDPILTEGTGSVTEDMGVDSGNLEASGTVSATGGDKGETEFKAETITSSVGSLKIEADGAWTYKANNSQAEVQGLKAGKSLTDTFTVTNADGVTTTTVTITINGKNDLPPGRGTVTEDSGVLGYLWTGGKLSNGDTEAGFTPATVTGSPGTLTINAAGGWFYSAVNSQSDIQDLSPTATLTDTFTVTSADSVTTTTVTITINGADDKPTLTGARAILFEDTSVVSGNLVANGTVSATGGDAGETRFIAKTISSSVGTLKIEADGSWTYTADNSQSVIQNLSLGGSPLIDTFTVTSADGVTTTTVAITIRGSYDPGEPLPRFWP